MNLALSEGIDRLCKWEKKKTQINALLFPHSQEFKVSTNGPCPHRWGQLHGYS